MRDTRSPDELSPNAPEGWTVENLADYEFFVRHDPPRPGSFFQQLKMDVRSREVLRHWAVGTGMIGVGLTAFWLEPEWRERRLKNLGVPLALIGACWLGLYLWLFLGAMRTVRLGRLLRGEIRSLGPNPFASGYSTAAARLSDGRCVLVSVPSAPAKALLDRNRQAEVLFLATPDERHGITIGIRADSDTRNLLRP